eukprot:4443293-Alexandrium_andersonii.AAC.1
MRQGTWQPRATTRCCQGRRTTPSRALPSVSSTTPEANSANGKHRSAIGAAARRSPAEAAPGERRYGVR